MHDRRILAAAFAASFCATAFAQDIPTDAPAFTEHVATLLRKEIADAPIVVAGPLTIKVGDLQANLDRVFAFCKRSADECAAELDRYAKGASQVHREQNLPPAKEAVRVVVRSTQYIQSAQASVGGSGAAIQPRPFVEGLVALPVIDSPRAIRMLGPKESERLGLTAQETFDLGIANLRRHQTPLMDIAKVAGQGQVGQLLGDSFHPSRLLLHDTWAPLVQAQGGALIVAAPTTDALVYVGEDTPMAIDALRALVRNVMSRAPNRLSGQLLRWTASGWEVIPAP